VVHLLHWTDAGPEDVEIVEARRINEIVHGHRRISADAALRLARLHDRTT
jgi:plasmid maintenance system antidote protein VapI